MGEQEGREIGYCDFVMAEPLGKGTVRTCKVLRLKVRMPHEERRTAKIRGSRGKAGGRSSTVACLTPINIPSMANRNDENAHRSIIHLIDNPIVGNANPVKIRTVGKLNATGRASILSESVDGGAQPTVKRGVAQV